MSSFPTAEAYDILSVMDCLSVGIGARIVDSEVRADGVRVIKRIDLSHVSIDPVFDARPKKPPKHRKLWINRQRRSRREMELNERTVAARLAQIERLERELWK